MSTLLNTYGIQGAKNCFYPREAWTAEASSSTYGNLGRSRRKTRVGPENEMTHLDCTHTKDLPITNVVFRGAAQSARLALDALPRVLLDRDDHVGGELKTTGMS